MRREKKHHKTFLAYIQQQERKVRFKKISGAQRIIGYFWLFFLYITLSLYRVLYLLFAPPVKSFTLNSQQNKNGTWKESYNQHIELQKGIRLFSLSSVLMITVSSLALFVIIQYIFPPEKTAPVQAADNNYIVSNNNDAGNGSLRMAITNANLAVGSVDIIFATPATDITLVTALPDLTHPVNMLVTDPFRMKVDGSNLGPGVDCWTLAAGSEGTQMVGMIFQNCPRHGLNITAANNITIGGTGDLANTVYAVDNGGYGIYLQSSSSNITNIIVGYPHTVGDGYGNTLGGVYIGGDNNTIDGLVTVNNTGPGLEIATAAEGNTVINSYFGLKTDLGNDLGNTKGVTIAGNNNTIGGTGTGNVIADNDEQGIYVDSVNGGTISNNIIGLNESANMALGNSNGIFLQNSQNVAITENTISGNNDNGIAVNSGANNTIIKNYLGTNSGGSNLGNAGLGINNTNGATDITIGGTVSNSNTIANNTFGGVGVDGNTTKYILISKNSFANNTPGNILLTNSGNESIAAPTVAGAGSTRINGSSSGTTGEKVEVYADNNYLGEATVNSNGDWSLLPEDISLTDFSSYDGASISAIYIDGNNNTSQFAASAKTLTTTAATLTVTDDAVFTDEIDVTAAIENGGILYYTTDNSTPTVASTSALDSVLLVFTETTTLKIFAVDNNNNTTAVQTKTYTKETSTDDDNTPDDNTPDDTLPDDNNNLEGTLDINYLKPKNTTINNLDVYNADELNYVPTNSLKIIGQVANNAHQVQVIIRQNKNDDLIESKWVEVNNEKWQRTVEQNLKKGNKYTVTAKARVKNNPEKTSAVFSLATVVATNPQPTITTLKPVVNVTANPKELVFGGLFQGEYNGAKFRIQNVASGEIVNTCAVAENGDQTTKNGSCTLDKILPNGDYRVLFHSLDQDLLSAPDFTRLTVAPAVARATFNLDDRSADFKYRLTTSKNLGLIGLKPENAIVKIYLNDVLQNIAETVEKINWKSTLDLSKYAYGDYLLTVKFFDEDKKEIADDLIFPFKYTANVINPSVLTSLPAKVNQNTFLNIIVLGGEGDVLTIYHNNASYQTLTLNENKSQGTATESIALPTTTIGQHTISLQTKNSAALSSTTLVLSYEVVKTPVNPVPTTKNTPNTEEPLNNNEPENQNNPPDNTPTDVTPDQENNNPVNNTPNDNEENIPALWKEPVKTETEKQEVAQRLNQLNKTKINTKAYSVVTDVNGQVVSQTELQKNDQGVTILYNTKISGMNFNWPGVSPKTETQTITFGGYTDPYAQVVLTVRSEPIVQVTRADENGEWKINVPIALLPAGEHSAYVQTTSKGVASNEVEIAKFVVVEKEKISSTTWIFIVNVLIVIVLLLLAIALQFRRRIKQMDRYSAPPIANKGNNRTSLKEAKTVAALTRATEEKSKNNLN